MSPAIHKDGISDKDTYSAHTVKQIVMAEQITQDVVKEAQSMGNALPIDDTATTTQSSAGDGQTPADPSTANPNSSKPSPTASQRDPSTTVAQVDGKTASDDVSGNDVAVSFPGRDNYGDQYSSPPQPRKGDFDTQIQTGAALKKRNDELVNGDPGEHSTVEDGVLQVPTDASGGSDTDISRPGSVDTAKDRSVGHIRSNSVKKPASFKSVSVTKNFLAKSAVSTPIQRPGEKGMFNAPLQMFATNRRTKASSAGPTIASAPQTAKPRLVAKSGSGIGNIPRSSLKTNGVGSGPDASKVWNKNQRE